MEKQPIRIAQIKAYVIKKRCRKEEFEIIEGIGSNDDEAKQNLIKKFEQAKSNWKQFRFIEPSIIYDAVRVKYDNYSTIQQPLMPNASDNVVKFDLPKA